MMTYQSTEIGRVRYLATLEDGERVLVVEKINGRFVSIPLDNAADRDLAITAAVNNVLAGAPTALNTLKELADALGDDANYAATVTTALGVRLRWRGAWAATTAYVTNDIVIFNGGLYIAPGSFTSGSVFVKSNWTELFPQSGTFVLNPTGGPYANLAALPSASSANLGRLYETTDGGIYRSNGTAYVTVRDPNDTYVAAKVSKLGVNMTMGPTSAPPNTGGLGWMFTRDALGQAMNIFYVDRGTTKWQFGVDFATDDFIPVNDSVAGLDLWRFASTSRAGYDPGCSILGPGVATPSNAHRLQIIGGVNDVTISSVLTLSAQRTNAAAASVYAGAAGVATGAVLKVQDGATTVAKILARGSAAFGKDFEGIANGGGIEVNRNVVVSTSAPSAWTANTLFVVGQVYQNAGTYYKVLTQYISGATFGATDTANSSVISQPSPSLLLRDVTGATKQWTVFNDLTNTNRFAIFNGTTTPVKIGFTSANNLLLLSINASDEAILGISTGKLGFYGKTGVLRPVLATGAAHTVDDVITALQTLGLVSQT